ncbi:MAG: hypothetical protein IPI68_12855 [Chitinophagaceae bacterium]|nr:hypothetical protein [Chitinophagaceae bacterium]
MPAIQKEIYSPLWHELTTVVIFGPTTFGMDNYKGNMTNWNDFGKFDINLNRGEIFCQITLRRKVHQLTQQY